MWLGLAAAMHAQGPCFENDSFVDSVDATVLGGCPASSTFNATQTARIDGSLRNGWTRRPSRRTRG